MVVQARLTLERVSDGRISRDERQVTTPMCRPHIELHYSAAAAASTAAAAAEVSRGERDFEKTGPPLCRRSATAVTYGDRFE